MKAPVPPYQTPWTGDMPIQWKQYFTQLELFTKGMPSSMQALPSYADDAAAAIGGVVLYGYYRTGSIVKQRVS